MAPSKKNLKATKKFEKKHLKGVLDHRKASAKTKQRFQVKAKKQAKRAKDADFYKGEKGDGDVKSSGGPPSRANGSKKSGKVGEMSVDDFFQGGFEILDSEEMGKKAKSAGKLGKRKRDGPKESEKFSEADSDSAMSIEDQPVVSEGSDDGGGSDDEDIGMSKKAMDELAEKDPEFYKFLKENDPEALDFDENADLAEVDELSAGDDDSEDEQPKKKQKKEKKGKKVEEESNELTQEMVAKWKEQLVESQSLRAARQVVLAFRSAAHLNEDDEDGPKQRFSISSPEVFHDILVLALKHIPLVMEHHLPVKESAAGKVYAPTEGKKFKTLAILLKTYTAAVIHLLGTLSDDATLKLTLSSLIPIVPYLLSFRKLLKVLIKTVVNFWARSASSESTRITAFLVLRRLIVIGDRSIRETVLKTTYQGLIQGSRITNINTIQGINIMKNSAAELWGIDQSVGYTTAFSFIRQLAIHLRNSIVNNKNDAYRIVYNWQYTHSLDFWSCVLSEHCSPLKEAEEGKESQLRPLIYPLVQVTLGAMRLIPTSLYFPLRFHLIRSILRLSRATGTYVPLGSVLLEVLESAEMRKPPKASTTKPLDFSVAYKAPKVYLKSRIYQDGVGDQVVELLGEYFVLWAKSIAFPEFSLPVVIQLKRWLKLSRGKSTGNRNSKLTGSLVALVQKVEANAKFIEGKRATVDFAPKDRAQVDAFLKDLEWEKTPLGAYIVVQRKVRAEKLKMLKEAREEDERKRKEEEREALEGAENMEEDDEEDEEKELDLEGEEDEEDDEDEEDGEDEEDEGDED
jgi:nucleolar complex protein 2